jgi:peptidoglycan hydrolase CwlO-like protein
MKYLTIILATMAVFFAIMAHALNSKLTTAEKNLSLVKAEKTALETEVKNYNEKSLQASKQIGELKKLIQEHKDDNSDGYHCLSVAIPSDIVEFLHDL